MNDATRTIDLPAPPWRRLLALLYELLVVAAILFVTDMLCLLLSHDRLDPRALWYRATLLLTVAAYFLLSWTRGGQTLGMRAWRLRLRTADGEPVTWPRALARFAILSAPLLLLALAPATGMAAAVAAPFVAWALYLATAAVDPRRRALHDILAGTELHWLRAPR